MCGILGVIGRPGRWPVPDDPSIPVGERLARSPILAEAAAYIANRGPDGLGAARLGLGSWEAVLIHSRLAVIDLHARSSQPMRRGRQVIAYNGEIYNYRELRDDLIARGARFETAGDTEVLLEAWRRDGLDGLPNCNGMFAFAVFDEATRELYLVRDRFGVKPLVWGRTSDGGLVFSSSVAAVAALIDARVDPAYCARGCFYQAFDRDDERSPFEGVRNVQAGGWLRVRFEDGELGVEAGRWYDLREAVRARADPIAVMAEPALLEVCRSLVVDAVRLRLRSDVPVACSLSGGLDSTSVAALALEQGVPISGFTYGHPDAPGSEGPLVAAFGQQSGLDVRFVWHSTDAAAMEASIDRTLRAQEAPFTSLSIVAQQEVFAAVRAAGVKVLLGGQGADEAFAGYRKFALVMLRQALTNRRPIESVAGLWSLGRMLLAEAGQAGRFLAALPRYRSRGEHTFRLLDLPVPREQLLGDPAAGLIGRQIDDVLRWSLPTLLRYEDRNSMGWGVESRLPFLDFRLMEMALALPAGLKLRGGYGKWALREVIGDRIPDAIRFSRAKRGFDVAQDWIGRGLGAYLRRAFAEVADPEGKGLNGAAVRSMTLLSDQQLASDPSLLAEALVGLWMLRPRHAVSPTMGPA